MTAYQTTDESWNVLQIDQTGNIIKQGLNLFGENSNKNSLKYFPENILQPESKNSCSKAKPSTKYLEHILYVEVFEENKKKFSLGPDDTVFHPLDEVVEPRLKLIDTSLDEYQEDIEREKLLNAWTSDNMQISTIKDLTVVEKINNRSNIVSTSNNNKRLQSLNKNNGEFKPINNILNNNMTLKENSIKRPISSNTKLKAKKKKTKRKEGF